MLNYNLEPIAHNGDSVILRICAIYHTNRQNLTILARSCNISLGSRALGSRLPLEFKKN